MSGFTTLQGKTAVYLADNVDTDRIIPARFLSMVTRQGYGELLFKDVRSEDFPLDQPSAAGATVLIVGTNFGCGSSREHAVWAIQQAGFKAVIARKTTDSPGYSDIFRQNSYNCGLLLIELEAEPHHKIAQAGNAADISIDLPAQTVTFQGESFAFEIKASVKEALVNGWDLIGTTLALNQKISEYESKNPNFTPASR